MDVVRQRTGVEAPVVALSFDDGPSEWTDRILDQLERHAAKATFFVVGDALAGRTKTVERLVREGHEIGNHTMSHPRLVTCDEYAIREELENANDRILAATSIRPTLFRPPHFEYDDRVLAAADALGFSATVLASVAPHDYRMSDARLIAAMVTSSVVPGTIVALHDGRPPNESDSLSLPDREATVAAVGLIVPALVARGYRIVTVSELLAS